MSRNLVLFKKIIIFFLNKNFFNKCDNILLMIFLKIKSETTKYTLYGILFGFLFPLISNLFEAWLKYRNISFSSLISIQLNTPLIWVIDSAPFFLGLFARFAGIRQDALIEKNQQINEEMKAARVVQESFLPEIPDFKGIELYYRYLPKQEVSGDFLIINQINSNKLSLFIGDVSGHGVSAALITSLTIAMINKIHKDLDFAPKIFFTKLNNELVNFIPKNKYITGIYGVFNNKGKNIDFSFSRGGHPYPVIWDAKKKDAFLIKSFGESLGYNTLIEYEVSSINMKSNDVLFLFTDGIIEIMNKNKEELGFKGLLAIIKDIMINNYSLKKSLDLIIYEIDSYKGAILANDDRILVGVLKK